MSGGPEFLDLEDLLALVRALGAGPVRDPGLLDSEAARPRATVFGVDAYPGLELKAAALLHSLSRSHPLVDGNKRLAWLATAVFLDLNAHEPGLDDDDAFKLVMDVAAGVEDAADVPQIAQRLRIRPC
jgi:death-on-curing protein